MVAPNFAERFAAYLNEHGYAWKHEPDYQAELGLPKRLETRPHFLIERHGQRAVGEARQFETTALRDYLAASGRAGALAPQQLFGPQRLAMWEKAKQLRHPPGTQADGVEHVGRCLQAPAAQDAEQLLTAVPDKQQTDDDANDEQRKIHGQPPWR